MKGNARCIVAVVAWVVVTCIPVSAQRPVASGRREAVRERDVQPLDPLSPAEREVAIRVARGDRRVREAVGGDSPILVNVEFLGIKSPDPSLGRDPVESGVDRNARVLLYEAGSDRGVAVAVDLDQGVVRDVTMIPSLAVPLSQEEVERAFALAIRQDSVRRLLGPRAGEFRVGPPTGRNRVPFRVEGLRTMATSREDPCAGHRCLDLFFQTPDGYLAGFRVSVDMTVQRVTVQGGP